jgi:hypothetical protein
MTWEVKFKKINSLFWNKIKNVNTDGFISKGVYLNSDNVPVNEFLNVRYFIQEDGTKIDIDGTNMIFKFSKERSLAIAQDIKKKAGK